MKFGWGVRNSQQQWNDCGKNFSERFIMIVFLIFITNLVQVISD